MHYLKLNFKHKQQTQYNILKLNISLLLLCVIFGTSACYLLYYSASKIAGYYLLSLTIIVFLFRQKLIQSSSKTSIKIGSHLVISIYFLVISIAIPFSGSLHSPLMGYYCLCPILADLLFYHHRIIIWTIAGFLGVCIQIIIHLYLPLSSSANHIQDIDYLVLMSLQVLTIVSYVYFNRRLTSQYQNRLQTLNKKLSVANIEAQKQVILKTQQLQQAKEVAEESSKIKTQFLANISHELRTPMHAILSFVDLSQSKLNDLYKDIKKNTIPLNQNTNSQNKNFDQNSSLQLGLAQKISSYQDNIAESASRMVLLISDLLDLSKLQSPNASYNMQPQSTHTLINSIHSELTALLSKKKQRIIITNNINNNNNNIKADSQKILQVLRNIIANSMKFAPDKSNINIHTTELTKHPGMIVIQISDQGPGVAESEKEDVFDAFVQSQKAMDHNNNLEYGTGLGLAICKKIIEAHGGIIWITNHKTKKTHLKPNIIKKNHPANYNCTFTFTVPKNY